MQVKRLIQEATARIASTSQSARLDAELLLAHTLGVTRVWLHAHPEADVEAKGFDELVARRVAGEPVEYLTTVASFYGHLFDVTPAVLIPRPETELLVERVASLIGSSAVRVVDVGTGSGIIAVTLALLCPNITIRAIDISSEALEVAKRNAIRHGVYRRIEFVEADLLSSEKEVQIVVSNPPYIAESYPLPLSVTYEPRLALIGGKQGDELLTRLVIEARRAGAKVIACEMGYDQRKSMASLLVKEGADEVDFYQDYAGFDRGFIAKWL
ncbi:MAG: peptide chain release factor N(5)-glutamine methyltransferase [Campylobacterales bacterium]